MVDLSTKLELFTRIAGLIKESKQQVRAAVNSAMVATYWSIGKLIVEDEQQGEARAQYGAELLKELGRNLSKEFGKGSIRDVINFVNLLVVSLIDASFDEARSEFASPFNAMPLHPR